MARSKSIGLLFAGLLLVAAVNGQSAGTPQDKPRLDQASIAYSDPGSGAQMYKDYCAACHGTNGKGDGPAAPFMKAPLTDLRTMAQRNGGTFPAERVASMLRFGTGSQAHGVADMPVWGPLFRAQRQLDEALVKQRIANLVDFIESLQQK